LTLCWWQMCYAFTVYCDVGTGKIYIVWHLCWFSSTKDVKSFVKTIANTSNNTLAKSMADTNTNTFVTVLFTAMHGMQMRLGVNRITYWSQGVASLPHKCQPSLPSGQSCTVLGCVHNVHSQQHTYMSSSYRSSRFGLPHWDPYAMHRGGCLELYYCIVLYSFIVQVDRTQFILHTSRPSFAYTVHL